MRTSLNAIALANTARGMIQQLSVKSRLPIRHFVKEWNICVEQSGFTGVYDFPLSYHRYPRRAYLIADLLHFAEQLENREADAEKTRITDVTAAHELALWMALPLGLASRKRLHPETVVSVCEAHDLALAIDATMSPVESDICDDFVELLLCIDCAEYIANGEFAEDTTPEQDKATCDGAIELSNTYKYISVGDSIGFYSNSPCACCKSNLGGERFNINNFGPVTDIKNNVTVPAEIDYMAVVAAEGFEIKESKRGRFWWSAKWECRDGSRKYRTAIDAAKDCCKSNNLLEA